MANSLLIWDKLKEITLRKTEDTSRASYLTLTVLYGNTNNAVCPVSSFFINGRIESWILEKQRINVTLFPNFINEKTRIQYILISWKSHMEARFFH